MRQERKGTSGGFTLQDLLIGLGAAVLAVVAAVVWIGIPLRDSERIGQCQRQMSRLSVAMAQYKDANQERLPALFAAGDPGSPLGRATVWGGPEARLNTADPKILAQVQAALGTNATQNFWLLQDPNYCYGPDAFHCPADGDWIPRTIPAGRADNARFGWIDPRNVSYGLHFPYAGMTAGPALPQPEHSKDGVILADRNPRRAWTDPMKANSNHERVLNFLEKDGSRNTYVGTDGKVGIDKDDIYTNADGTGGVPRYNGPRDAAGLATEPLTDTVIWPLDAR